MSAPAEPARGRGRPPSCSRELAIRIVELRGRKLSYTQICDVFNAEGVLTPMGGSYWQKSHVDRLLHTKFVQSIVREFEDAPAGLSRCSG